MFGPDPVKLGYPLNFITALKLESSTASGSVSEVAGKENAYNWLSQREEPFWSCTKDARSRMDPDLVAQNMVPVTPMDP